VIQLSSQKPSPGKISLLRLSATALSIHPRRHPSHVKCPLSLLLIGRPPTPHRRPSLLSSRRATEDGNLPPTVALHSQQIGSPHQKKHHLSRYFSFFEISIHQMLEKRRLHFSLLDQLQICPPHRSYPATSTLLVSLQTHCLPLQDLLFPTAVWLLLDLSSQS
jgi:hypothetical protein